MCLRTLRRKLGRHCDLRDAICDVRYYVSGSIIVGLPRFAVLLARVFTDPAQEALNVTVTCTMRFVKYVYMYYTCQVEIRANVVKVRPRTMQRR